MNKQIRYDLQRNPPYQINYRAKRAGKHITASKRRITFQFGFSSAEAIASGQIEGACRGEEHEVVLVWSHVSGKRELFMDGKLIHTSRGAYGNTKFQFTWGIGPHILKIVGNFKDQSKNAAGRQFDLQLDGISFFRFLNIYQLGQVRVKGSATSINSASNSYAQAHPKMMYSYQGAAYKDADDMDSTKQTSENVPPVVKVMPMDLLDAPSLALSLVSSGSTLDTTDEFCPKSYHSVSNTILSAYNNPSNVSQMPPSDGSNSRALVPVANQMFGYYGQSGY